MTGYLTRLCDRMQKRGWPPSDPLYQEVRAAHDALHRLHVRLRYLSAPAGTTGRRPDGRRQ